MLKKFLLSTNTNFTFNLFGFPHLVMLFTMFILLILIFVFRKKLYLLDPIKKKNLRIAMAIVILGTMLIYKVSYIYYGRYDVRLHLPLYFCHIINYLFVLIVLTRSNVLYKLIFCLSWVASFFAIIFPGVYDGFDCLIYYVFFNTHNLLMVFTVLLTVMYGLKLKLKDCAMALMSATIIFFFTQVVNYDFKTSYNSPTNMLAVFDFVLKTNYAGKCLILLLGVTISLIVGFIVNAIYTRKLNKIYIKQKIIKM